MFHFSRFAQNTSVGEDGISLRASPEWQPRTGTTAEVSGGAGSWTDDRGYVQDGTGTPVTAIGLQKEGEVIRTHTLPDSRTGLHSAGIGESASDAQPGIPVGSVGSPLLVAGAAASTTEEAVLQPVAEPLAGPRTSLPSSSATSSPSIVGPAVPPPAVTLPVTLATDTAASLEQPMGGQQQPAGPSMWQALASRLPSRLPAAAPSLYRISETRSVAPTEMADGADKRLNQSVAPFKTTDAATSALTSRGVPEQAVGLAMNQVAGNGAAREAEGGGSSETASDLSTIPNWLQGAQNDNASSLGSKDTPLVDMLSSQTTASAATLAAGTEDANAASAAAVTIASSTHATHQEGGGVGSLGLSGGTGGGGSTGGSGGTGFSGGSTGSGVTARTASSAATAFEWNDVSSPNFNHPSQTNLNAPCPITHCRLFSDDGNCQSENKFHN